jgi:hypothetical protein
VLSAVYISGAQPDLNSTAQTDDSSENFPFPKDKANRNFSNACEDQYGETKVMQLLSSC